VAFSALLVVLAFLAGLEVKRICMGSSTLHFEGLESAYRKQQRTLHDLVRTAITAATTADARGDTDAVTGALDTLIGEVNKVEYDLSVATPDINVLRVLRRLRDKHPERVHLDVPQGAGDLPQRVGELIVRCARNLVDNAVKYGLAGVEVHFRVDSRREVAVLSVTDNGPGFDAREFADEATTLHDLRQEARAQGGDMLVRRRGERNEVLVFASLQDPR
jgi:signal transduction histidine kinase